MSTADPIPSTKHTGAAASHGPLSGGLGIVVFVALFAAAAFLTYRTLTTAPIPTAEPIKVTFFCIETKKPFESQLNEGEKWPILSPYTGRKTGFPAEECYWTRDNKRKELPTYVVLNETLGKSGDTLCPDCGRIVVGHNPLPADTVPLASPSSQPSSAATTQPAE